MPLVAALSVSSVLTLIAVRVCLESMGYGAGSVLLFSLALLGQMFHVLMLGGLVGRSALTGLGLGSLLTIASVLPWEPGRYLDAFRELLGYPWHLCLVAMPLLLARHFWGWQLVQRSDSHIPYRRWRLEDYFLLTASLAAFWILLSVSRNPLRLHQNVFASSWYWLVIAVGLVASCLVLTAIYFAFRLKLSDWQLYCGLCGLALPPFLLVALLGRGDMLWVALLGVPLCALCWFIMIGLYKFGGLRLAHYAERIERAEEELSEEDYRHVMLSRSSARWSTALFFILAIVANLAYHVKDRNLRDSMLNEFPSQSTTP